MDKQLYEQALHRLEWIALGLGFALIVVSALTVIVCLANLRKLAISGELILRDKAGKPRITIGVGADDAPRIDFWDPNGRIRAWMGLKEGTTPGLAMFDEDGPRFMLGLEGSSAFHGLVGKDRTTRLAIASNDEHQTSLRLCDSSGTDRFVITIPTEGDPTLEMFDKAGKRRTWIGTDAADNPAIMLFDTEGVTKAWLGWAEAAGPAPPPPEPGATKQSEVPPAEPSDPAPKDRVGDVG